MNERSHAPEAAFDVETAVKHRKLSLLFRNSGIALWVNVANASLLAYVNWTFHASSAIPVWWAVVLAIATGRYLLARRFNVAHPDAASSTIWFRRYFAATMLMAVAWAGGAFLFMWHSPDDALLFSSLVLAGMMAGALPILAPVYAAYRAYAVLIAVPMALIILLQASSALHVALGIMVLIFLGAMLMSARSLHETLDLSISLGLRQGQLIERLEQAKDTAEHALAERRHAEYALRASEERYRSILQHSPTGILHYDNDLVITYCNDRFVQIIQAPKEDIIALDLKNLNDQRIVPALRTALDGKASTYEGEYVSTLTGATIWISMSCAPLHGLHGGIDGGIAIVEDISNRKQAEIALRRNEQQFRYLLETSPIAVRIAGLSGRKVLFANRGYVDLLESESDRVLGLDPRDYYVDPQEYENILHRLSAGEIVTDTLVKLDIPGRAPKWALASYRALEYENEPAVLGWFYDITDRRRAEEALREEQEKLRGLFELSPLGICLADMDGRFVEFNEAFRNMTGYTEPELTILDYWVLTPKKYQDQEAAQLESLRKSGRYGPYEKEYRRKDGSLVPIRLNGMIVTGANGQSYIWSIVEDITEHKKIEQQLEQLAHTDSLTGIANRRGFMEIAEQEATRARRSGEPLSFLMLDVDHFKHTNDTHGHRAGDAVLIRLGELCQLALRGYDTVGRLGGEEFAALLPRTDGEQALAVAQRMRSMIDGSEVLLEQGTRLHFTVSIGVATLAGDLTSIDTLQRQADSALYEAKRRGRNRVCVYEAEQSAA